MFGVAKFNPILVFCLFLFYLLKAGAACLFASFTPFNSPVCITNRTLSICANIHLSIDILIYPPLSVRQFDELYMRISVCLFLVSRLLICLCDSLLTYLSHLSRCIHPSTNRSILQSMPSFSSIILSSFFR